MRHKHKLDLLLDVSKLARSTYYYHVKNREKPDKYAGIKEEILRIFNENKQRYGYRQVTLKLKTMGCNINHKTVFRLMKVLGLVCRVRMKKYRSYKGAVGKVAENLLNRDFEAAKPNKKLVTDVTEFHLVGEKLYLSPILGLCSRDIITTPFLNDQL